ncbi:MAG TPA: TetR/AcrR family transcriptional regulator, partial [Nannocystaceae bacterium]|nr:TetR/AcrR family transcriptional regulator [Nannocystaceae bacterium]
MAKRAASKKVAMEGRRRPIQARSQATVEALLEATAQILAREGPAAASTNAIAARAGVSIGSLYQYFPDRDALIAELSRRHVAAMQAAVTAAISGVEDQPLEVAIRQLMGALVAAHRIDPRLDQALHRLLPLVGGAEIDAFEAYFRAQGLFGV